MVTLASAVPTRARANPRRATRPARDADRTRAAILDAATQEFARHGLGGARVDRIAAKVRSVLDGRLRYESAPPDAVVSGDEQRLTQALLNLLQNAVVHTVGDSPIELRAIEREESWRFEVVDQGGGLPPGEEDLVFEPFHRLNGDRPGSGLGLAIVKGIAEGHGGRAGVDNRPGKGATFWIEVPR